MGRVQQKDEGMHGNGVNALTNGIKLKTSIAGHNIAAAA